MLTRFPGMTVEVVNLKEGSSKSLFEGIFAAGGITLSQVSAMTGLEPYMIQNWVKRGFLPSPKKRLYSKEQFSRVVIINMLRESLQLERICALIRELGGVLEDDGAEKFGDDVLYHKYVDMLATAEININDEDSVNSAAARAADSFDGKTANIKKRLANILKVMVYAHSASVFRKMSEDIIAAMD